MVDSVLIVDDSLTVRMDLKEAFEDVGFQTVVCATVAAARQALADPGCAVVVLQSGLRPAKCHDVADLRSDRAEPAMQRRSQGPVV